MRKDFCLMYRVWLKSFDSLRCKKAKVIFNIYRGGRKREKEQPGHTPGLLDNCPRIPSTMLCSDSREELWFCRSNTSSKKQTKKHDA